MFSERYRAELERLRREAVGFSEKAPALASALAVASSDPDVERILEGLAWFTTDIRDRLEDGYPELIAPILGLLAPMGVYPQPALALLSIGEHVPPGLENIPSGSQFSVQLNDEVQCRFRTTESLALTPLRLVDAQWLQPVHPDTTAQSLELHFSLTGRTFRQWNGSGFRLHIGGAIGEAAELHCWLRCAVQCIELVIPNEPPRRLAEADIRSGISTDAPPLLPLPVETAPATRVLTELTRLPHHFAAVDIALGPQRLDTDCTRFRLRLHGTGRWGLPAVVPPLALHVVPAVNLYAAQAEPVWLDKTRRYHRVQPRGGQGEVFSIDQIETVSESGADRIEYRPWHEAILAQEACPAYQVVRQVRRTEAGHDMEVELLHGEVAEQLAGQRVLRAWLQCSDGRHAGRVAPGSPLEAEGDLPHQLQASLWTRPCAWRDPPATAHHLWRQLARLGGGLRGIDSVIDLRTVLLGQVFTGDMPQGESDRVWQRRIEAIESFSVRPLRRLLGRALVRGNQYTVQLPARVFLGRGDWFLFGETLFRLLAAERGFNTLTELQLVDPEQECTACWYESATGEVAAHMQVAAHGN